MVDYSKWDNLELSDDSDIEVHPNVDKRSFIRAKQAQIHMKREQRKRQIEAVKYERVINGTLQQRLSALLYALKSHADEARTRTRTPAEVAFQAVMELAPRNSEEDNPPSRPYGVYLEDDDASDTKPQQQPSYSMMIARILDEVNKSLDERRIEVYRRYDAFIDEVGVHVQRLEELERDLIKNLNELENEDTNKITSESYHVGFDSSHINDAATPSSSGESKEASNTRIHLELLNLSSSSKESLGSSTDAVMKPFRDGEELIRASPAAEEFGRIKPSDYRASREFILSHPQIIREPETEGLLLEAFEVALKPGNDGRVKQLVHQAVVLQCCRMLGPDGVALFFNRVTKPGLQARQFFEKEVAEKLERIQGFIRQQRRAAEEGVEQIQIQAVEPGTAIQISIPPAKNGDENDQKARAIFDSFTPEMRAALESGSLDEVNQVLGSMPVPEAEALVNLLGDAGCLSLEKKIIDTTTEEGMRQLRDIQKAVGTEESVREA